MKSTAKSVELPVMTGNRVGIRPLAARDFSAVKEIERIIVDEYLEYLKRTKEKDTIEPWITSDYFNYYLQTETSYVAEAGRKIVGFILSQTTSFVHGANRELWLEYIAVLPESRRKGVGTALVSNTMNNAKTHGISLLYTSLNPNNHESIQFLSRHGFDVKDWKQATRKMV